MQPRRISTISEYHQVRELPRPEHPLISVINLDQLDKSYDCEPVSLVLDFYSIALKRNPHSKMKYGQQTYDFDEGVLFFIAPGQVFSIEPAPASDRPAGANPVKSSGWIMLIHPDFLWNTPLARTIRHYDYFDYAVHEALFLSDKEEETMVGIIRSIQQEYQSAIDTLSRDIIVAQLEVLLKYAERFYKRQFITRSLTNNKLLDRLESTLDAYFARELLIETGLPTVQYVADALNVSPNYLSGLLKTLTGQSTQQHIHNKLIERAKAQLSTTDLSVNEIAYALGFEHPQSFSKLFKSKTSQSPVEFRQSFN
ncbi:helix-turn-helix domain-containing protein [Spirosoma rhododendri]|uniref:Helix-turn-helix transcriptional regulator n=1 Tax=Spirosoma rhododendri TaxID=2728024 RepID=A0A7L5DTG1_9BACT|nr:response regulator transcription factor [Spirosoma rhododendri]QJD80721.1 helix-turn-helix transcriptional regulator [Spirosoma rhododendri]